MSSNRLILAAAGSGKTTLIVNDVLANKTEKILITTFTLANEQSIRERLIKANNGCLPTNVVVQPWFSFLIKNGVRPYRFWDGRVAGMHLVTKASGFRYNLSNGNPVYWGENDFFKYYFNSNMKVYSDKLSKLFFRCNKNSGGHVLKRLEKNYRHIYIDEVQDMAGWDLELIKLFLKSSINLTIVGDPRQTVYLTHHDKKYPKYDYGKIKDFIQIECTKLKCSIDETTLASSHRNSVEICALSSKLFPTLPACISKLNKTNSHTGIYFVRLKDVQKYCDVFHPIQLRLRSDIKVYANTLYMTFGESKGLESEHILLYPTKDMLKWLCGENVNLKDKTRAQLYVALTRAFFSIAIVVKDTFKVTIDGITIWENIAL
jgi:DNA helicase-2/ATP-dependent DNA helicase PcrA